MSLNVKKVGIQRVYQIKEFENVKIYFEIEVSGNHREAILQAYKEILNMEKTIAEFEYTKNAYANLRDRINISRDETIFDDRLEKLESIRNDKLKTLGCLEKIDINKISELPTACIEELNINTLKDIENRKQKLKEEIEEIEAVLNKNKELEKEWRNLENEYKETIDRAEQHFLEARFEDAVGILRNLRDKIEHLKREIDDADPEHYRYSWR